MHKPTVFITQAQVDAFFKVALEVDASGGSEAIVCYHTTDGMVKFFLTFQRDRSKPMDLKFRLEVESVDGHFHVQHEWYNSFLGFSQFLSNFVV